MKIAFDEKKIGTCPLSGQCGGHIPGFIRDSGKQN